MIKDREIIKVKLCRVKIIWEFILRVQFRVLRVDGAGPSYGGM